MQNYFQKNEKKEECLTGAIDRACEGLIYVSEQDAPVRRFSAASVADLTAEILLRQAGLAADTAVEEIAFNDFFARLTAERDWHAEPQRERAKRFLDLQKLLEENLARLKIFKLGRIRVEIFAVGIDKDGRLMGVKTEAVET